MKRDKLGGYATSINSATADGLLSLEFKPVAVEGIEATPRQGKAPFAVLDLPESVIATDD